ncbi:hypothetical protein J2T11_003266 [Paenarthrobacter nicotinovorans]|nr:hypothetical protein [Paenarthrobacter nicotinovorans]
MHCCDCAIRRFPAGGAIAGAAHDVKPECEGARADPFDPNRRDNLLAEP